MSKNDIECQYDRVDTDDLSILSKATENKLDELWEALKQCYYTILFIFIVISAIVLIIYLSTVIFT